jgi:hypothetical protein
MVSMHNRGKARGRRQVLSLRGKVREGWGEETQAGRKEDTLVDNAILTLLDCMGNATHERTIRMVVKND